MILPRTLGYVIKLFENVDYFIFKGDQQGNVLVTVTRLHKSNLGICVDGDKFRLIKIPDRVSDEIWGYVRYVIFTL